MRTMAGAFTAVNFAQSAVFGMAVNGSAGGALTPAADLTQHADDQKGGIDRMHETGLTGWPGAVGKFGVDAVVNVDALLSFQLYAKGLAERIQQVKNAARITLNDEGIDQVFGEGGDQEASLRLNGIGIQATSDKFEVHGRRIANVEAGEQMFLDSPFIRLGHQSPAGNLPFVKIDEENMTVRAETSKSSLELKGDATTLISGTISIGHGLVVPDPRAAILGAEELAAQKLVDAATRAADRLFSTYENALSESAKGSALEAWYSASDIQKEESDKLDSIKLKRAQLPAPTEYLNGLQVDAAATSLTHASGSLSVASASIDMKLGSTELKLDPMGMNFVASLIRLG
jgi:type VI secretion system secreted protein VgrG